MTFSGQALRRGAVAALMTAAAVAGADATEIESSLFGGLRARSIGPAVMSGRVAALDAAAHPEHEGRLVIWIGSASGGVWKSEDRGLSFEPVFDDHIQSIGAVRIDPNDADRVWIGTGESWVRNSTSIGDGVYRTTDGGETWQHLGLEDTERIARIVVHPEESDTAWVCATGHLWGANEQRGVFKTTDGGQTWQHVLQIDADTGCSDLDIDPQDADILYAGMWQFRRFPWSFDSGGPGSGLYRSKDGGETWHELTEGLPEGEKGRIAVGVAPSRASRVYAVVEADETALYRSDDLGASWESVNSSSAVSMRPFYFANVFVDPRDPDRVYKPGLFLGISSDGGESFGNGGALHPDLHAVWINPANPQEVLVGSDGGVYHSYDAGRSFRHVQSLPLSQYYEVAADNDWPYNVYGGLQDNGTWMGPSRASGGITAAMWRNIGFGDGFHAYPDPRDSNTIFVEYQGGELLKVSRDTGEIQEIKPYPGLDDPDHRCNWNSAMHLPARGGAFYTGCQFLFRTEDQGASWSRISADLTTDDPEKQQQEGSGGLTIDNSTAENHTTIYTISESPLDPQVIWVGTDDGNVQVTRDGGETWSDVTAGATATGVPPLTWVAHVEASPHVVGTAFVAFDGHRLGDMTPYLYRTDDFGSSWTALLPPIATETVADESETNGDTGAEQAEAEAEPAWPIAGWQRGGVRGFAHVLLQDPVQPGLLFAGTELGLFLSIDGGEQWARFDGNLPPVPVHDLDIHPTEHDLIIGTHGRGIYIIDDLTPLRALDGGQLDEKFLTLPSRPSVQMLSAQTQSFLSASEYVGETLGEVATIFYYQNRRHIFGDFKVEILDTDGELVATLPGSKRKGINRVEWPMRRRAPRLPASTTLARAMTGPRVPEGRYTVRITKGKQQFESAIELIADPRSRHSAEDRAVQQRLANDLYDVLDDLTYVADALVDLQEQITATPTDDLRRRTARELEEFTDALEAVREELVATGSGGMISGEEELREKLGNLFGAVAGFDGRPTDSQVARAGVLTEQFRRVQERFETLVAERLASLGEELEEPLLLKTREQWQQEQDTAGSSAAAAAFAEGSLNFHLWRTAAR